MKEFVKEKFDNIVSRYDLVNSLGSFFIDSLWRKKVVFLLKDSEGPFLDVCCGPFTLSKKIYQTYKKSLFGLDISKKMLLYGYYKKRVKNFPKIYPVCGDGEILPFKENSFGALTIAFGLRNLPDKKKALSEFFRVLKPQGKLLILEFSLPSRSIFKKLYLFYLEKILPFIGGLLTGDKEAYEYLAESIQKFPPPREIRKMLKNTGFKKIRSYPMTQGIVTIYKAIKP